MRLARAILPRRVLDAYRRLRQRPTVGEVDFGDLRRLRPIDSAWGWGRGLPVDRHYIEVFLGDHAADVRGRVLEVGDTTYTRQFGGDGVDEAEVLHAPPGTPAATYVDDLASGEQLPSDAFDCFICTQTIHLIPDAGAAVRTIHRILRPGGVLLMTGPTVSRIATTEQKVWGDYWRFTADGARRLLEGAFPPSEIDVSAYGNLITCIAFLHGIAREELSEEELRHGDPDFPMLVAVRARKPER